MVSTDDLAELRDAADRLEIAFPRVDHVVAAAPGRDAVGPADLFGRWQIEHAQPVGVVVPIREALLERGLVGGQELPEERGQRRRSEVHLCGTERKARAVEVPGDLLELVTGGLERRGDGERGLERLIEAEQRQPIRCRDAHVQPGGIVVHDREQAAFAHRRGGGAQLQRQPGRDDDARGRQGPCVSPRAAARIDRAATGRRKPARDALSHRRSRRETPSGETKASAVDCRRRRRRWRRPSPPTT